VSISPQGWRWNTSSQDVERSCDGTAAKRQLAKGVLGPSKTGFGWGCSDRAITKPVGAVGETLPPLSFVCPLGSLPLGLALPSKIPVLQVRGRC
jgi:hypothetical protein